MRKILLFELNEVPFRILDFYAERNPTSYLAKFIGKCRQFTTYTEDEIQLDPWISWPTLHRGVNDRKHGILHLGQTIDESVETEFPAIWQKLKQAGAKVGVFGSLNTSSVPSDYRDYAFYLPDYFAGDLVAFPESLMGFHKFNVAMTRQSARNVTTSVPIRGALDFVKSTVLGGLKADTVGAIARHLVDERLDSKHRVRRRSLQPLIMCDLFLHQVSETRPDFATFYTNHVAAAMHRYWAASLPGDYTEALDREWVDSYEGEIPFALQKLESMLAKVVGFVRANPEYCLVVASSLGQAAIPFQKTFEFLTITDVGKFLASAGVSPEHWEIAPAMVPNISVRLKDVDLVSLRAKLERMTIGGARMVYSSRPDKRACFDLREGYLHLFVQFDNYTGPDSILVGDERKTFQECGLGTMAHEDGVNCTAQHVPQGSLLVYDPMHPDSSRALISTIDFVPSVLANYGIDNPSSLAGKASIRF